ncbi:hypothetical protein EYF80_064043 [Liparis tanakae]|uniref:Uncharacterized protein n=1 Tax=Liparis tanakae TaxID=230148 RepID=A0A4Z2EAP5_9TELE|nr:hypothetical protein EYF80_064043 [Liparis tanakae]
MERDSPTARQPAAATTTTTTEPGAMQQQQEEEEEQQQRERKSSSCTPAGSGASGVFGRKWRRVLRTRPSGNSLNRLQSHQQTEGWAATVWVYTGRYRYYNIMGANQ